MIVRDDSPNDGPATAALASPVDMAVSCDPAYRRRPDLEPISQELSRMLSGQISRLLVWMHPQSGKSTLASMWTPFWWLANRPGEKSVVATYSSALAAQQNRLVHRLVDANGQRYGLEHHGSGARWLVTEGGGVWHVGVGSAMSVPVTGIAIIDDPHRNRAEAESPVIRQRVDDWYLAEFLARLAPGTPLLIMQSPWHRHDLGHTVLEREGRVEDGGAWTVLGNGSPLLV